MVRFNHSFNKVLRKAWKSKGNGDFTNDEKVILSLLSNVGYVDAYKLTITALGISYLHTIRYEFITMMLPLVVSIISLLISLALLLKELNLIIL